MTSQKLSALRAKEKYHSALVEQVNDILDRHDPFKAIDAIDAVDESIVDHSIVGSRFKMPGFRSAMRKMILSEVAKLENVDIAGMAKAEFLCPFRPKRKSFSMYFRQDQIKTFREFKKLARKHAGGYSGAIFAMMQDFIKSHTLLDTKSIPA